VWRVEVSCVMVIGAHEVECAEWPRAFRGMPSRSLKLPIATDGAELYVGPRPRGTASAPRGGEQLSSERPGDSCLPDAAMHRAVSEMASSFFAESAATPSHSSPRRLRVLVCDRWIALTTVPWSQPLVRTATQDRFLRSHLEAAGFETTVADTVRMDEEAAFGRPRIAVAYPALLMGMLADAAATLGAHLESVQPLEVAVARLARSRVGRSARALAILDRERLRFMDMAAGGLTAGQSLVELALLADRSSSIQALWRRQQLRDPALGERARLHALDLRGPASDATPPASSDVAFVEWPQGREAALSPAMRAALVVDPGSSLNGSKTPPKRSAAGWLVSAACLILAAILGAHAHRLSTAARTLELAVERQTRTPTLPTPPKWTREDLARIRAVNAAIREINLPIAPVLRALQPPRDIRVALLGIVVEPAGAADRSADGANAALKLNAESASGAEMARYVGYLAERPPLVRAYLVNHVVDETDSAHPYRFTVEVAWRE